MIITRHKQHKCFNGNFTTLNFDIKEEVTIITSFIEESKIFDQHTVSAEHVLKALLQYLQSKQIVSPYHGKYSYYSVDIDVLNDSETGVSEQRVAELGYLIISFVKKEFSS